VVVDLACLFGLAGSFWTSALGHSKGQKAPGNQKPKVPQSELLGFWLVGAFWLLEGPKAPRKLKQAGP